MEQSIECAHDPCQCTVISPMQTETYCSDFCKNAGETGGIEQETCNCGHPQCDVP